MILSEQFDQHKLAYIIANEATFKDKLRPDCITEVWNPFALMKKYLIKSRNGITKVKYYQNDGVGRMWAQEALSLQSLPREIRHTIATNYTDVDMVNAHPVILAHMCLEKGIDCPLLDDYILNRDELLKTIDNNKVVVLSIINGGSKAYKELATKPQWLTDFKKEMDMIHHRFAFGDEFDNHKAKRIESGKDWNHNASYVNTLLCDFENAILMSMFRYFGKPEDAVLCFDGIMLTTPDINLTACEDHVLDELGIVIKLKIKPMDEGLDLSGCDITPYEDVVYNRFNFDDPYNYKTLHSEFNCRSFKSVKELDDAIDGKYQRCCALILAGKGSFAKKEPDGCVTVVDKLGRSGFNMFVGEGKKKVKINFEDYISSKDAYARFVCDMEEPCDTDFNMWSGFQAKHGTDSRVELMKSFIKEVWANNDEESYNYIISWFAGLLTPGINKTALAMISPQGAGKGFFLEFMKLILRKNNVADVVGIQSITQKHNTAIQGKRLNVINEMSSSKDEFKSNFDKIKSYITDPTIQIEPKGVNPYSIDNIGNYLLFTNHRDAIIVEGSDRRYAIFEMNTSHLNDTAYFNELAENCMNQEVANAFYSYLMEFQGVDVREIPDTALRREMMNLSKSTPLKFIDHVLSTYKSSTVTATQFYQQYTYWCRENGERNIFTGTKFSTAIRDVSIIQRQRVRTGTVYHITTNNTDNDSDEE